MDTLKGNSEYRNYLETSRWDIIVIDECHNVAMRKGDTGSSLRARLAKQLATKSDTLILLSATPHDGSAHSFASLIWLLDPTAISDPDDFTRADLDRKDLFVRRFKKDIKGQAQGQFPEPVTRRLSAKAAPQEEAAFQAVLQIPFTQRGEPAQGRQGELQRVGLQKALFSSPAAPPPEPHRFFEDIYAFAKQAIATIPEADGYRIDDQARMLRLDPPADLRRRLRRQLPAEVLRETDQYLLSAHRGIVEESIQRAREADRQGAAWPDIQFLWPQHPICQWLMDRVIGAVGRRRAPVIASTQLAADEHAFLMLGLIPNRKGQPLIAEWKAVTRQGQADYVVEDFDAFCARAGIAERKLPNSRRPVDLAALQGSLGEAVATMAHFVEGQVTDFSAARDAEVRRKLAELDELRGAQERQLELRLEPSDQPEQLKQGKRAQRLKDIEHVFTEYGQWVRDSLEVQSVPFVQVLAGVTGART